MMLAHQDGRLQPVNVPNNELANRTTEQVLERVYVWGQNDFQPVPECCSVSIGDVALYHGRFWILRSYEWVEICPADLEKYAKIDQRDRTWSKYVRPEYIIRKRVEQA